MVGLIATLLYAMSAAAQAPPTAEQIIERLKSGQGGTPQQGQRRITRGLSAPIGQPPAAPGAADPAAASAGPVAPPKVQRYFVEPRRGLSVGERQEVAAIAQARPTIDLTIYFDFDSAQISPKAVPALVELGRALSSDTLKGTRFLLAGHTDAKGGDAYNLKLSQRRADAIRRYLATQFRIEEQRLLAIGYGKEQLKNTANPLADENRRVQVVNFGG
jgi:outer membrane protein OmpA-like peptidoglycan-associated protein